MKLVQRLIKYMHPLAIFEDDFLCSGLVINRHAGSDFLENNLWNIINKQFQFSFGLANMRGVKFSNAWREKFKRMS